jgi:hypothetical protein
LLRKGENKLLFDVEDQSAENLKIKKIARELMRDGD